MKFDPKKIGEEADEMIRQLNQGSDDAAAEEQPAGEDAAIAQTEGDQTSEGTAEVVATTGTPDIETGGATITPTSVEVQEVPIYGATVIVTITVPEVERITYLKEDNVQAILNGSKHVPTDAQFQIVFSDTMDESSHNAVLLTGPDEKAIRFQPTWSSEQAELVIVPEARLQYATQYTLEVGKEAKSSAGILIELTETARAEFTTAQSE